MRPYRNPIKQKLKSAPIARFYLSKIKSNKMDKKEWELMHPERMKVIFTDCLADIIRSQHPDDIGLIPKIKEVLETLKARK